MKRVAISASQFRFSKPGVDVGNPGVNGLIFDGFSGAPYNGVYLSGFLSSLTQVSSGSYQGTINFGKTFAAAPKAMVRLNDTHVNNARTSNYFAAGNTPAQSVQYSYTVSQNSLVVTVYGGTSYPLNVAFSYLVLQV